MDYDHNATDATELGKNAQRFFRYFRLGKAETPVIFISRPDLKCGAPKPRAVCRYRAALILRQYATAIKTFISSTEENCLPAGTATAVLLTAYILRIWALCAWPKKLRPCLSRVLFRNAARLVCALSFIGGRQRADRI